MSKRLIRHLSTTAYKYLSQGIGMENNSQINTSTEPFISSVSLKLEEIDKNLYRSAGKLWQPASARAVFGGQVVGQALVASSKTISEDVHLHSAHCYFVAPGDATIPIIYQVETIRNGRSFCTRFVKAIQRGECILTMMTSYHKMEVMEIENQFKMPEATPPEELMSYEVLLAELLKNKRSSLTEEQIKNFEKTISNIGAIEIKPVDPFIYYKMVPVPEPRILVWIKVRGNLGDSYNENFHRSAAAYISDMALLRSALVQFPKFKIGIIASLDHAMWFHIPFRSDEWMLYECESPRLVNNRAMTLGRLWKRDGSLAMSVAQEGLIRGKIDETLKSML